VEFKDVSQLQLTDVDSVKSAAEYVIVAHDEIKNQYIYTVLEDIAKYGIGFTVGAYQTFVLIRRLIKFLKRRKDEKRINTLIQRLSESIKKDNES
jgi:hypothetical protein